MPELPTCTPRVLNQDMRLFEAAKLGDIDRTTELIYEGLDVNDCDANGVTPLIMACSVGNLELVELLLEAGAEKGCQDR